MAKELDGRLMLLEQRVRTGLKNLPHYDVLVELCWIRNACDEILKEAPSLPPREAWDPNA